MPDRDIVALVAPMLLVMIGSYAALYEHRVGERRYLRLTPLNHVVLATRGLVAPAERPRYGGRMPAKIFARAMLGFVIALGKSIQAVVKIRIGGTWLTRGREHPSRVPVRNRKQTES